MSQKARVISVHVGAQHTLEKAGRDRIEFALDGIIGDRHRGVGRTCWKGDKQPEGTERRNERQWSAVSEEELAAISHAMSLTEGLQAETLGANLCLAGVSDLSRLPRGTLLNFESGAILMVEEYNPPCIDMGAAIARRYRTTAGGHPAPQAFSDAAKFRRGILGTVEIAGTVAVGDTVTITPERLPKWLRQ
jgi:MOSC domain-containing protein YiiM